jgi:UDP-glucose 4-epimerase
MPLTVMTITGGADYLGNHTAKQLAVAWEESRFVKPWSNA